MQLFKKEKYFNKRTLTILGFIKIKWIKKFKLQKRVDNAEIIHIMYNDKFNKPFVDFLNKNFDTKKHLILCARGEECLTRPFPTGDNVIEIQDVRLIDFSSKKIKKIICHSLFMMDLVEKLYEEPKLLKNSYWLMWGGDLYEAPRDTKNDFVRKNFKGYLTVSPGDKDYLINKYGIKNVNSRNVQYIVPTDIQILNEAMQKKEGGNSIHIQINNSACETTIEILEILSKFKDENINITTILSYGNIEYNDDIINKGKSIFGEKFKYLDKMISPEDYAKHIASIDLYIANQDRQQGLGNIFLALYSKAKIFIKSNISSYKFLNENFTIYDTNNIKNLSFEEFIKNDYKEINQRKAQTFFDENEIKQLWESVFNEKAM